MTRPRKAVCIDCGRTMPIMRVKRVGNTYECRNDEECAIHAQAERPYALGFAVGDKVWWLAAHGYRSEYGRESVDTLVFARRYRTERTAWMAARLHREYQPYRLLPTIEKLTGPTHTEIR